jgi:hypothetical protein
MDYNFSDSIDHTPVYSSYSQVIDPRSRPLGQTTVIEPRSYDQESKVKVKKSHDQGPEGESRSQVTSTTGPETSESKYSKAGSIENSADIEGSGQAQKGFLGSNDFSHMLGGGNNDIDQTATVLNAFSLGKPSVRRSDSGMTHGSVVMPPQHLRCGGI